MKNIIEHFYNYGETLHLPESDIRDWGEYLKFCHFHQIKTYGDYENGFQLDIYARYHEETILIEFSYGDQIKTFYFNKINQFMEFMNNYKNLISLLKDCRLIEEE